MLRSWSLPTIRFCEVELSIWISSIPTGPSCFAVTFSALQTTVKLSSFCLTSSSDYYFTSSAPTTFTRIIFATARSLLAVLHSPICFPLVLSRFGHAIDTSADTSPTPPISSASSVWRPQIISQFPGSKPWAFSHMTANSCLSKRSTAWIIYSEPSEFHFISSILPITQCSAPPGVAFGFTPLWPRQRWEVIWLLPTRCYYLATLCLQLIL